MSYSQIGVTGHRGTPGVTGIDWKKMLMQEYPRFTIEGRETRQIRDRFIFDLTVTITDKITGKKYEFDVEKDYDVINETEQFIKKLIIDIRNSKLDELV